MADLEIKINRRKKKRGGRSAQSDGSPIYGTRKEEYLARRQSSGINFYDLGQSSTGVTNPVHIANSADSSGYDFPFPPDAEIDSLILDLETSIFAIAEASWRSSFKKVSKGSLWDKAISLVLSGGSPVRLRSSDHWTSDGLKLSNAELTDFSLTFDIFLYNQFSGIGDTIAGDVKVTAIRDPDASSVTFTPAAKMNIYLMPAIVDSFAQASYFSGPDEITEQLNYLWNILDRPLYLPADEINVESAMKNMTIARAIRITNGTVVAPLSPSSFPGGGSPDYQLQSGFDAQSAFLCAIETSGQWFYFWRV